MPPQTQYVRSGDADIAYQVLGNGPIDLVVVPGWISNVEVYWEEPNWARFTERLATFSRVILFDKRGTGLSDRVSGLPPLETRMEDVKAVMDAAGSQRAALFGWSEGGPMCALFAATYPDRTLALVMAGSYARRLQAEGYPGGLSEAQLEASVHEVRKNWGQAVGLASRCASKVGDARFEAWWCKFLRQSASPSAAIALMQMNALVDVRPVLPVISVPTLVLHSRQDPLMNIEEGRFLARSIPAAKLVEYDSPDHVPYLQGSEIVTDEMEKFLTGTSHAMETDRVLATVMFTDIVQSTQQAAALGDRNWRDLLHTHHQVVRTELSRFRGKEVDTAGDGFFAVFDGPARAIRCARAISQAMPPLGISVRIGIHTGECEVIGEKYGGIAVHTGARVAAQAAADQVWVSSTVKDLVAGSGLNFTDCGERELKGIPGSWRLYAAN